MLSLVFGGSRIIMTAHSSNFQLAVQSQSLIISWYHCRHIIKLPEFWYYVWYKGRSIQIICCVNFHPARDVRQSTFHTTADDDHPHGSFVGQYCQGQAQEITVEVILCKYSRQCDITQLHARNAITTRGVVSFIGAGWRLNCTCAFK